MTLLCVAESWSLSANCGAQAEYAYCRGSVDVVDMRPQTYVCSTCQRNGCGSNDGHNARLLVGNRLLQVDHHRQAQYCVKESRQSSSIRLGGLRNGSKWVEQITAMHGSRGWDRGQTRSDDRRRAARSTQSTETSARQQQTEGNPTDFAVS